MSSQRDHAADLTAFLSPDVNNGYGADLPARRLAAQDRRDAKDDRASAAADRRVLSDVSHAPEAPDVVAPVDADAVPVAPGRVPRPRSD